MKKIIRAVLLHWARECNRSRFYYKDWGEETMGGALSKLWTSYARLYREVAKALR